MGLDDDTRPRDPAPRVDLRDDVRVSGGAASPTRCPYCHDHIPAEEYGQALVCETCLSRHHAECWVGKCGSCGSLRALGAATPVAAHPTPPAPRVAPPRVPTRSAAELAATRADPYEVRKRQVNWTFLILCALSFASQAFVSLLFGTLTSEAADVRVVVVPVALTLFAGCMGIVMTVVNFLDAWTRRWRDPTTGWNSVLLALLSPVTGGLTGVLYYATWGRHPLPPKAGQLHPAPPEEPVEKGA